MVGKALFFVYRRLFGSSRNAWIHDGLIARASAEEALDWHQRQATFWAVVLAPWVLVQDDSAALNS